MVDEHALELINKEIDGVISPEELSVLEEYRSKNPEIDVMTTQLRAVVGALGTVRPAEAPGTLKSRVMRELHSTHQRQEGLAERFSTPVLDFFRESTRTIFNHLTLNTSVGGSMANPTTTSRGPKIALMGGIAILAVVAIIYFSFYYPPAKTEDVSGTIGAARKYRSEQITDKDVKLEGQNAETIASSESIADIQSANELAAAAASFENTFKALDSRVTLDATFRSAYQRTALALNGTAKAMERAPRNSYDARAVADLRSNAASLEATAKAMIAQKAQATFDNRLALDMRAQMNSIDARANDLQRTMAVYESRPGLDSRSSAVDAKAKIDARSTAVDNRAKAKELDNRSGVNNKAQ
jgi:hypothetical protein